MATRPGSEWKLQTPRLIIRPVEIGDAQAWFAIRTASPTQPQGRTLESMRLAVTEMAGTIPGSRPGWHQFMIVDRDAVRGGSILGDIGVCFGGEGVPHIGERQAEIGFELHPTWRKRGIAREAVDRLIEHLLHPVGLHRLIAITTSSNRDAQKLLEHLGFQREAHYVESVPDGAGWQDEFGYALRARR